jgi:hypothetical protein
VLPNFRSFGQLQEISEKSVQSLVAPLVVLAQRYGTPISSTVEFSAYNLTQSVHVLVNELKKALFIFAYFNVANSLWY